MIRPTEIGSNLSLAETLLRADELVAIPTETVYGLAGNALSERAVARIFQVKNRPTFDPLIIHTSTAERIAEWVEEVPAVLLPLLKACLPGPLTLLLPKKSCIPDLVTSGSSVVAVRVPDHPLTRALLARLDFPLAAPSANPFGYISPTTAEHVARQLGGKIPYIIDGGPCRVGVESTIVGMEDGLPTIFRKGGLPVETIEVIIGPVQLKEYSTSQPLAPGMLKSHYAPMTPLLMLDAAAGWPTGLSPARVGVLAFRQALPQAPLAHQVVLAPTGDLAEAAQNLFSGLRQLDELGLDAIVAEWLPEEGLGRAINDRLRRAAAKAE